MGLERFRLGHAVPNIHIGKRAPDSCSTGGFYKYPTASTTLDSLQPVNITWDTSCLSVNNVDIYLYAPSVPNPRIHMWSQVPFAQGWYQDTLKPRWWNSSAEVNLQFSIVEAGNPPFLTSFPAGPVFTATYDSSSGSTPEDADPSIKESGTTVVGSSNLQSGGQSSQSMSPGKVAAAVLVPIVVVVLAVLAWLKMKRQKEKAKRKEWSEKVDARMSTISVDWKSITTAGANAAIRHSMAVSSSDNRRASSFSFGNIRPQTTYSDGGQAGVGVFRGVGAENNPSMAQLRSSVYTGERQSRVSFAEGTRPSSERSRPSFATDRRSRADSMYATNRPSRAFHSAFAPPMPVPDTSASTGSAESPDGTLSPTQTAGPISLTPEAINARFSYYDPDSLSPPATPNVQDAQREQQNPHLSTAADEGNYVIFADGGDDYAASPANGAIALPQTPARVHTPTSATHAMFSGFASGPGMQEDSTSPDEMLRAYAARRAAAGSAVPMSPPPSTPNGRRLTLGPATPGTYSPSMGAYGVQSRWE